MAEINKIQLPDGTEYDLKDTTSGYITDSDIPVTSVNNKTGAVVLNASDVGAQSEITAIGILKGDGGGGVTAAVAGADYQAPISNNVTGSGTSGSLAKFNGTNTITNGPALGSSTTTYLRNDGSWATPPNSTYNFSGTTFYSGNSTTAEHNANNAVKNGNYYYSSNGPATSLGASTSDGALYVQSYSDVWVGQIAQDYRNGGLFVRGKNNGTWQSWQKVYDSAHKPTAADIGAAASSHTHAAGDITSGTLGVARGGTGAASFTANCAIVSGSSTTAALTTRAITNSTAATTAITGSTNLVTMNTLRYALNRTTGPGTADTNYTTAMMRPIYAGTTDMTAGTTALTSGTIYLFYEA